LLSLSVRFFVEVKNKPNIQKKIGTSTQKKKKSRIQNDFWNPENKK